MTAVAEQARPISAAWRSALREAAIRNRHQRALVLRFPEIAKRLTQPPMRLADPAQWTGYIPGYWQNEDRHGRMQPNSSPVRAQLAEILQAAAERADQQPGDGVGLDDPMQAPATAVMPPWRPR